MKERWFFLRGLIRETAHWQSFLSAFAQAFPERAVVPLDLPGTGRLRELPSPWNVPGITEIMRGQLLAQGEGKNILFAISLGGMVGFDWISRYPQDFTAGVFLNSSLRGLSPLSHRLRPANYLRLLRMFGPMRPVNREKKILKLTSSLSHPGLAEEWARLAEERPVSKSTALRQLVAAARFSPPHERPRPPLLLLNSLGDRLVAPDCSQKIADHWQLPLRSHPTAGHDLTLDAPSWVLEQLKKIP
jgi:pimeloyl-ACP methyl ester carboxylesterase